MKLDFTDLENTIIKQIAENKGITETVLLRQALRLYESTDKLLAKEKPVCGVGMPLELVNLQDILNSLAN